ncbi:hypothetical protein MMC25_005100 [Agyrium rufum]|nr:hypothetical protein [Agyrium rufum]
MLCSRRYVGRRQWLLLSDLRRTGHPSVNCLQHRQVSFKIRNATGDLEPIFTNQEQPSQRTELRRVSQAAIASDDSPRPSPGVSVRQELGRLQENLENGRTDIEWTGENPEQHGGRHSTDRNAKREWVTRPKKQRQPPSQVLVDALIAAGHAEATPRASVGKWDLSYGYGGHLLPKSSSYRVEMQHDKVIVNKEDAPSLPLILATYVANVSASPELREVDVDANEILLPHLQEYLSRRSYRPSDVPLWNAILTADDAEVAAEKLYTSWHDLKGLPDTPDEPTPVFVLTFFLRRNFIPAKALHHVLHHTWDRLAAIIDTVPVSVSPEGEGNTLEGNMLSDSPEDDDTESHPCIPTHRLNAITILIITIRLLRHARKVWPAAFPSIILLFTQCIERRFRGLPLDYGSRRLLSRIHNTVLTLLGMPTSQAPFANLEYQQQAQFLLLRSMNVYNPPITITRQGYHSLVRVQSAHRKTQLEKRWADLKAKSWPPWKEEKLGLDQDVEVESGISRAMQAMQRMQESGYGLSEVWGQPASIQAGWDTDQSPTIQTRSWLSRSPVKTVDLLRTKLSRSGGSSGESWAARIRATRTVNEAWSCFQQFKNGTNAISHTPYLVMLEKLVREQDRQRLDSKVNQQSTQAAQGEDGWEVVAVPIAPKDDVYLATPPPTAQEFLDTMVEKRIHVSKHLMAFLLRRAQSRNAGVIYFRASNIPPLVRRILMDWAINVGDSKTLHELKHELSTLPDHLLTAILSFTARFDRKNLPVYSPNEGLLRRITQQNSSPHHLSVYPLTYQLVFIANTNYRPHWHVLLRQSGISTRKMVTKVQDLKEDINICYYKLEIMRILQDKPVHNDLEGFRYICVAFTKAILAGEQLTRHNILQEAERNKEILMHIKLSERLLNTGPIMLKAAFEKIIGSAEYPVDVFPRYTNKSDGGNLNMRIPDLLEVPSPHVLHALIRALGVAGNYVGLWQLAKWMRKYHEQIDVRISQLSSGESLRRQVLVAMRVFLERSWLHVGESDECHHQSEHVNDDFENAVEQEQANIGEQQGPSIIASEPASPKYIRKIRHAVEAIDHWGGWPTDNEVKEYCRKGNMPLPSNVSR